jgi:hypothetical protein
MTPNVLIQLIESYDANALKPTQTSMVTVLTARQARRKLDGTGILGQDMSSSKRYAYVTFCPISEGQSQG